MASTSPPCVFKAYYEQFQRDFSIFLKCRAEELVAGGRMVLTFLGRRSEDPSSKECCYIYELMAMALNDMVSEVILTYATTYSTLDSKLWKAYYWLHLIMIGRHITNYFLNFDYLI